MLSLFSLHTRAYYTTEHATRKGMSRNCSDKRSPFDVTNAPESAPTGADCANKKRHACEPEAIPKPGSASYIAAYLPAERRPRAKHVYTNEWDRLDQQKEAARVAASGSRCAV